jgi:hypothetical protein
MGRNGTPQKAQFTLDLHLTPDGERLIFFDDLRPYSPTSQGTVNMCGVALACGASHKLAECRSFGDLLPVAFGSGLGCDQAGHSLVRVRADFLSLCYHSQCDLELDSLVLTR